MPTVVELRKLARDKNIKGRSKMNKAQLMLALNIKNTNTMSSRKISTGRKVTITSSNMFPKNPNKVNIVKTFIVSNPEKVADGLYEIKPDKPINSTYIAAFDMDHTLSYGEKKLFPIDEDDIYILPQRREFLEALIKKGYRLLLFTNQFSRGKAQETKKLNRVTTFLQKLELPMTAYVATKKNEFRKPDIGAWNLFTSNHTVDYSVFCGDAFGRPGDFSDSDKQFGLNAGMQVVEPEKIFAPVTVNIHKTNPNLIMFVGPPGVGKSSIYNNHFNHYTHISQDILKTRNKVIKAIKTNIGNNMVIDGTNSQKVKRQEIYKLLPENYNIQILYFVNDGRRGNSQRTGKDKVSTIVYHVFFKKLDRPDTNEFLGHSGQVYTIDGYNVKFN